MRSLKSLAVIVVSSLAAMAAIGVSSASATELCSTVTSPCSGTKYGSGTSLEATLVKETKATLGGGSVTVTCSGMTLKGETTSAGSGAEGVVSGTVTTLSFQECKAGEVNCTVETKNLPYVAEISAIEAGDGAVFLTDPTGLSAAVKCGVISCTFTAAEAEFALNGGNPALLTASKAPFQGSGGGSCPAAPTLSAEMQVGKPAPMQAVGTGIWMRANPGALNYGPVTVGNTVDKLITFRYVGGGAGPFEMLPVFTENLKGTAFSVAIDGGGKPLENCAAIKFTQGVQCTAEIRFKPESKGMKETKVALDEKTGAARHFDLIALGEGI